MNRIPFKSSTVRSGYMHGMLVALLCIHALMNWGCSSVMKKIKPEYKPGDIIETSNRPDHYHGRVGEKIRDIPVLFIGEIHNNPDHHIFQREVIEILYRMGKTMAIGMEMFPREVQPILDRWTQDGMEEHEFLEEVGWGDVWGFPLRCIGIFWFLPKNTILTLWIELRRPGLFEKFQWMVWIHWMLPIEKKLRLRSI